MTELDSQAEGSVQMVIRAEDRRVVQRFERDVLFVAYDPPNAVAVAKALSDAAFEADTSLKPVGETLKAELVQKHRETLIPRAALMLGTLRADKLVSDGALALKLVDQFCSEVFS